MDIPMAARDRISRSGWAFAEKREDLFASTIATVDTEFVAVGADEDGGSLLRDIAELKA